MAGYLSRCPQCGAVNDEDAGECSRCGVALRDEVVALEPAGVAGIGVAPAITAPAPAPAPAPATWRSRRVPARVVAPALAVLFVAGLGVGRVSDRPSAGPATNGPATTTTAGAPVAPATVVTTTTLPPPFLDQPAQTKLVLAGLESLTLVDLDASRTSTVPVPGLRPGRTCPGCPGPVPLARVGDRLVFQGEGSTFAVDSDLSEAPRALGPSLMFVPSWREGRVWLVERGSDNRPLMVEVDLTGQATSPARALPPDWVPHAPVEGGLLLHRGDRFRVWDPSTGRVRLEGDASTVPLAASGEFVAWARYCDASPLCSIHLTNVRTGEDRSIPFGTHLGTAGAFSPDRRRLAFFAYEPNIVPSGHDSGNRLVVLDVETGRATSVPTTDAAVGRIVWSPSGQWVFMLSEPHPVARVHAYRLDSSGLVPVRLPPDISAFGLVTM